MNSISPRYRHSTAFSLLLALFLSLNASAVLADESGSFSDAVIAQSKQLADAKLREKPAIVEALEASGGEAMIPLFMVMLEGDLYAEKATDLPWHLIKVDGNYNARSLFGDELREDVNKRQYKKVRVNNALRIKLRQSIARLSLASANPEKRLASAKEMVDRMNADNAEVFRERLPAEADSAVKDQIALGLALFDLQESEDPQLRRQSLLSLEGRLEPAVRDTLNQMLQLDDAGEPLAQDAALRASAERILADINAKVKRYQRVEQLFFGLSLGSVFLLIATGLAITFGVMGVINMAHGELMMLGAYTTYVVQLLMPNAIEYSLFVAIPAAFLVSGAVGVLMERSVIRFLHGRPLETLLATFGISLILQQAVRSIFSPLNRPVQTPDWMSGSLQINEVLSLTYNRLYILIFALLVFAVLQLIMKRTSLGLQVRAVSQNRNMAKAIGIRTEWVDAMTFGLGAGIAGIAGVALSQLTNVGPNLGQAYIIDSFMVVVFGGAGNLWGTLVAGFSLGVTNKFLEPVTGAVLANILVLVFIILFIQKRPKGLFPQKGRAAE